MQLMKMAARYDSELTEKIKQDPIITILSSRRDKFALARGYLTDPSASSFFFVLNAEKLPILETVRAVEMLGRHGVFVGGILVNKVIPPEAGAFFEKRRTAQEGYLEDIRTRFASLKQVELPLLDSDIQGTEQLEQLALHLENLDA